MKEFEVLVDDLIMEIKDKCKKAIKERRDKSQFLSINGNYQVKLKEFNFKLIEAFDLFQEIRKLLFDNQEAKFLVDNVTGKQYIS